MAKNTFCVQFFNACNFIIIVFGDLKLKNRYKLKVVKNPLVLSDVFNKDPFLMDKDILCSDIHK